MTAAEALREATAALREAGLEGAARDARLLLAHAMGLGADRVGLHLSDPIDPAAQARLAGFVQARSRRQPVSQIIGQRLFWGRPFRVTRDVLDPRPETELLVAIGLEEAFAQVLDLGTGSGAICSAFWPTVPWRPGWESICPSRPLTWRARTPSGWA